MSDELTREELADRGLQKDTGPLIQDRVTAQLNVVFEPFREEAVQFQAAYASLLDCKSAEAYTRRLQVGAEWEELDLGWCKNSAGLIIIDNKTGKYLERKPSPEEIEAQKNSVVEISWRGDDVSDVIISPGRFLIVEPAQVETVRIKARQETVRITLAVIPK